ncbi:hypothetical protein M3Y99_00848600 [Aphelenchoides fujianensis]|nr:hypothetical protein M3Y99_00848600 [Aphelenchoides fujianensis]
MGAAEWRPPRRLLLAFEAVWADVHRALRRGLYVDRMTFLLLAALAFSLLLLLVCMPLICCCRRRRSRSEHSRQTTEPVKRRFPLTVARFEEFDALSPLIASPSNNPPSFRHKRIENEATRATRELFLRQHIRRADESPPPPRRFNGRTQIVPLTGSANPRPLVVPLLGTPDTKRKKETLQVPGRRIYDEPPTDDLISIDRTYVSTRDVHNWPVPKIRPVLPAYAPSPVPTPEFRLAPPTYSPPAPPRVDSHHSTPVRRPNHARQEMTVQSNLSR